MSAIENVLEDLRGSEGGPVVIQQADYALRIRLGVHGAILADALVADFNTPPAPPPEAEPETQPEILAAASELVGRLNRSNLRTLEEIVVDALQSCAAPVSSTREQAADI